MPYKLIIQEQDSFGKKKFVNAGGNTECVEYVRQATTAPHTTSWKPGKRIFGAKPGVIEKGIAIATFDENGRYPSDKAGKHAAIYLSHDALGISVLDQWNAQGEVKKRIIRFNKPKGTSRSDDGTTFYVLE